MIAYIVRRCLYAVPILVGVNVGVFILFFFVNTPDDMARARLGRRATPETLDEWKRERSLDLPYFYNAGWRRLGAVVAAEKEAAKSIDLPGPGDYRLVVETAQDVEAAKGRRIRIQAPREWPIAPGAGLDIGTENAASAALPERPGTVVHPFAISGTAKPGEAPLSIRVSLAVAAPAPTQRVVLEYRDSIGTPSRFTRTVFWQRSIRMLAFQFGKSDDGKEIWDEVLERIAPSLSITVPIFLVALFVEIFIAMIIAFYRGTYLDIWAVIVCVIAMSVSAMFYIIGGQAALGKWLRLFPISGFDDGVHSLKFILLPVLIGVVAGLGSSIRWYRTIFLEEINKDYIRTARAKGLPEGAVLFRHALKNAMIPILTGLVVSIPFLFVGSLLLESFLAIPGMGSFTIDAIQRQDFAIVQAMVSLGSFLYIVGLVLTDLSYTLVDPRVRLE